MFGVDLPIWLIPILKVLGGPALIWILRNLVPGMVKKHLPAAWQPAVAAFINVIVAIATGADPAMSISALTEALVTLLQTLGVIKGLDFVYGKVYAVTAAEKKKILYA